MLIIYYLLGIEIKILFYTKLKFNERMNFMGKKPYKIKIRNTESFILDKILDQVEKRYKLTKERKKSK